MPTLNTSLAIGRSALRAQQFALTTVGNNIANVNTPGYSRKATLLKVENAGGADAPGGGVRIDGMTRMRDRFLDSQFRFEGSILGRLEVETGLMGTVEAIFTEMAGGGSSETSAIFNQASGAALSGGFSRFFNAFHDLANNPQSQGARAQVREEATFIIQQFQRMHDKLSDLSTNIDLDIKDTVKQINLITRDIAELNQRILTGKEKTTDVAGNLDDERDRLIDDLSRLIDASVRANADGTLTVKGTSGGGFSLVEGVTSTELGTRAIVRNGESVSVVTRAATDETIVVSSGRLKGLSEVRDEKIPDFKNSLDVMALTFVERVNAVHGTGYGLDGTSGNNFFEPTLSNARDIRLSADIADNLNKIATAAPHADNSGISAGLGDGSVAQAIGDLAHERSFGEGQRTIEEFYSDLLGSIGAESREIINDFEGQTLVMEQVSNRRENVRGVSINEEASDLILFQRAYQAAARIITTVNELMQTILSM